MLEILAKTLCNQEYLGVKLYAKIRERADTSLVST